MSVFAHLLYCRVSIEKHHLRAFFGYTECFRNAFILKTARYKVRKKMAGHGFVSHFGILKMKVFHKVRDAHCTSVPKVYSILH